MKKLLAIVLALTLFCAMSAMMVSAKYEQEGDFLVTDFEGEGVLNWEKLEQNGKFPENMTVEDGALKIGDIGCWFSLDKFKIDDKNSEDSGGAFEEISRGYKYIVYVLKFEGGATLNDIYIKNYGNANKELPQVDDGKGPGANAPIQSACGLSDPQAPTDDLLIMPEVYTNYVYEKGADYRMCSIEFERWQREGEEMPGYIYVDEIYLTNVKPANNKPADGSEVPEDVTEPPVDTTDPAGDDDDDDETDPAVVDTTEPADDGADAAGGGMSMPMIVGLAVAGVAVVGGGAFFLLKKKK